VTGTPRAIAAARLERWSPRTFTGEEIPEADLATILEAAGWASTDDSRNWRILYARRRSIHWPLFLAVLSEFNASWTEQAGALLLVVSRPLSLPTTAATGVSSRSRPFDAAAAWTHLALQASLSGWQAQALVGFDRDSAAIALNLPPDYAVATAVAIGRHGLASLLPGRLAVREHPNNRRALSEIAMEGGFPAR